MPYAAENCVSRLIDRIGEGLYLGPFFPLDSTGLMRYHGKYVLLAEHDFQVGKTQ